MVIASEFSAYPQRWVTGVDIPTNPVTGERMAAQFLGGADRVWGVESDTAKFGNFAVSDLGIYVKAIEMLIQHVAAQTRTPPHYLLGAMGSFPSGESLKATETGLVAKVRRKMLSFGEGWEEAMRLAFAVEGDTSRAEMIDVETIWANPESRIVGETVDAAVKLQAIGVPRPALWEYIGASPQQIARWMVEGEPKPTPVLRETVSVAATPQQGVEIATGEPVTGRPPVVRRGPPHPAAAHRRRWRRREAGRHDHEFAGALPRIGRGTNKHPRGWRSEGSTPNYRDGDGAGHRVRADRRHGQRADRSQIQGWSSRPAWLHGGHRPDWAGGAGRACRPARSDRPRRAAGTAGRYRPDGAGRSWR